MAPSERSGTTGCIYTCRLRNVKGISAPRVPSYALAVPILVLLAVLVSWLLPRWSGLEVLDATVPLFLPLAPIIFRCSRVIWAHLDWTIDPGA